MAIIVQTFFFLVQSKCLYILELTVGFESTKDNAVRKEGKYMNLVKDMKSYYRCVNSVGKPLHELGVFSNECSTFLEMMNDVGALTKTNNTIHQ